MTNWVRKIEYCEYACSDIDVLKNPDIRKCSEIRKGTIDVSYFELAFAIAKSIISKEAVFKREMLLLAVSYAIQLQFIFTKNKKNYLSINFENKDLFRDFSKSSRDGEIAQGINYLLAQKLLGAVAVEDFKTYAYDILKCSPKCSKKTPDYILKYKGNELGVLESKGSLNADPTQSLDYAMKQCDSGIDYLKYNKIKCKNSYASVVTFATSKNNKRNSCIYFADPVIGDASVDDFDKSIFREYSKWFYIAGNENVANMLKKGEVITENNDFLRTSMDNSEHIAISRRVQYDLIDNKQYIVELGIHSHALQYLQGKREWKKFESNLDVNSDGVYEQYSDGTYIRISEVTEERLKHFDSLYF